MKIEEVSKIFERKFRFDLIKKYGEEMMEVYKHVENLSEGEIFHVGLDYKGSFHFQCTSEYFLEIVGEFKGKYVYDVGSVGEHGTVVRVGLDGGLTIVSVLSESEMERFNALEKR